MFHVKQKIPYIVIYFFHSYLLVIDWYCFEYSKLITVTFRQQNNLFGKIIFIWRFSLASFHKSI
jgi:hypothetical protein